VVLVIALKSRPLTSWALSKNAEQPVRITTQLSDGEMPSQHAGAPALVCALRLAARGRALYAERRSLQRRVRRLTAGARFS
jgi:hypothetical protein